jgi:hypothetical protein
MEENKFLEAQNLKNQISKLEKWLQDTKRENAKIGVCWSVYTQEYHNINSTSWYPKGKISYLTNELPESIKDKVIQLVKDEIEKLNEEFNKL